MNRWMDKEDMVYIYNIMKYYSIIKIQNDVICSNMDRPRDYHIKWTKLDKEKYHVITYMWNLKKINTNELIYKINRLTDFENRHGYQRGKVGREGILGVWD